MQKILAKELGRGNIRLSTRLWGILTTHKFDMGNPGRNTFSECYEFLSELCHPNSFGLNIGKKIDENFIVTYFKKTHLLGKNISILPGILISVQFFLWSYDKARKLIIENEEVPIITTKKE